MGKKFRDKHGKIRKWPSTKGDNKLEYIQDLVSKMIAAGVGREAPATSPLPKNLVRRPHTIAPQYTAALSKQVKKEQLQRVQLQSAPKDDPVGVPLLEKYKRKVFYEYDVAKSKRRTYRVLDVRYKTKSSEWIACSAPVEKTAAGTWKIPAVHLVDAGASGTAVVKEKSYEHHVLADVSDPGNVLYADYFDLYIKAHLDRETTRNTESSSSSSNSSGKGKNKKRKR